MSDKVTVADLEAAARARGIALAKTESAAVQAGAIWLKGCVALLRKAGLGK